MLCLPYAWQCRYVRKDICYKFACVCSGYLLKAWNWVLNTLVIFVYFYCNCVSKIWCVSAVDIKAQFKCV